MNTAKKAALVLAAAGAAPGAAAATATATTGHDGANAPGVAAPSPGGVS
ncbi:chaplin, partial [Streptomyces sp. H27-D2]|nr:chaplin [Streptomyces sp. H27-D2]